MTLTFIFLEENGIFLPSWPMGGLLFLLGSVLKVQERYPYLDERRCCPLLAQPAIAPSEGNSTAPLVENVVTVAVWGTLGTIRPHLNFDAAKDAQIFFEAISGEDFDPSWSTSNSRGRSRVCRLLVWRPRLKLGPPKGVNYEVVIDLLTSRSSEHRQQIAEAFLDFTQQSLLKTLEAVVPNHSESIIRALLRPAAQNDAHEIQAGLQSLEVESLIEIVSTRRAKQLQETLVYYKQDFKSDLETDIAYGTTGGFQELLLALIKGERERYSGMIDYVLIRQDSKALADAAAGGDAECPEQSEWVRILAQRSPEHLRRGKASPMLQAGHHTVVFRHAGIPKHARLSGQIGLGRLVPVTLMESLFKS